MAILESMKKRRSIYNLGKLDAGLSDEQISQIIEETTELTPDAFNMKSSRVVVVFGKKHEELWDKIYDTFEGEVPREKIDMFKNAHGTVLYFKDSEVVEKLASEYPLYANNFAKWSSQATGMLEHNVWVALAENNIGANIQHYNPVIDLMVREMFDLPATWELDAQMPFGKVLATADEKEKEDISKRVKISK